MRATGHFPLSFTKIAIRWLPGVLFAAACLSAAPAFAAQTCVTPPVPAPAPVCDGVADDQAALQALIDQASATGAPAKIPVTAQGCNVTGPLCVNSNTVVIQDGLLKLSGYTFATPSKQYGIYTIVRNAQNVTIMGRGTIDGGLLPNQEPLGCCLGGIVAGGPAVIGDYDANIKNVTIRGLRIVNTPTWPISIDGTTGVRIDGVTSVNGRFSFQVGHNSHDVIVSNVRISEIRDVGFTFYRGINNGIISNLIVSDARGAGISVFTDTPPEVGPGRPSDYININGNLVYRASGGIDVQSQRVPNSVGIYSRGVNITNNHVHHNQLSGISLIGCAGCQVVGNQSHHNTGNAKIRYPNGINIAGGFGVLAAGNQIYNEGSRDGSIYYPGRGIGVHEICDLGTASTRPTPMQVLCVGNILFPATHLVAVLANHVYDDQAVKTMEAAMDANSLAQPVISVDNIWGPVGWLPDVSYPPPGSIFSNYIMP